MGISIDPQPNAAMKVDFSNPKKSSQCPFLTVLGPKGAGKSSSISTIPKADDKKHFFLTADQNTEKGLLRFWTDRLGSIEKAREYAKKHFVVLELTPYYSKVDISQSRIAADYAQAVFDRVYEAGKEGIVAGFFVEHYDVLFSELGVDLVRFETNTQKGKRPPFRQYGIRNDFLDPIDGVVEEISCDVKIIAGYGPRPVTRQVFNEETGKDEVTTDIELPSWIEKRNLVRNSDARLVLSEETDEKEIGGRTIKIARYEAFVEHTTNPHFDKYSVKNITGKGLEPFFPADGWYGEMIGLGGKV